MKTTTKFISHAILLASGIIGSNFGVNFSYSKTIGIGAEHALIVCSSNVVKATGQNNSGQLGDGTYIDKSILVQTFGLTGAKAVSSGYYFSVALKNNGTVSSWGNNQYGQLGDGSIVTSNNYVVQVYNLTSVTAIDAGYLHSVALKSDGTVRSWGYNNSGQLGNGSQASSNIPVQVSGLTSVIAVSAGYYHSLALKSNGTVWAWGDNTSGELGDGTTILRTAPVQVSGITGIIAISAGEYFSLALKNDGTVWAWGRNNRGQLGDGSISTKLTPVQVSGLAGVTSIAAGVLHSIAVKSNGTVWVWGDNVAGQLANGGPLGNPGYSTSPLQVSGLSNVVEVEAGWQSCLAVKSNGQVWGWGRNACGQLGMGSIWPAATSTPTLMSNTGSGGCSVIILPVEITLFKGKYENGIAKLQWQTASELNNDYFVVEKGNYINENEINWAPVGSVSGNGNISVTQDYEFMDESVNETKNEFVYYRLKQVDFDGKSEYFGPVTIQIIENDAIELIIHNSISSDELLSTVLLSEDASIQSEVLDMQGRTIEKRTDAGYKGSNSLKFDLYGIASGIYFLKATVDKNQMKAKFVKQ